MPSRNGRISLDSVVIRQNELPTAEISGEVVMMNLEKGKYFALDSVGSRIWELMENKQVVEDIISILLDEYDIDAQTCQEHVLEFMNKLYTEGLLDLMNNDA